MEMGSLLDETRILAEIFTIHSQTQLHQHGVRTRCFETLFLLDKECKVGDIDQNMLIWMLAGYR